MGNTKLKKLCRRLGIKQYAAVGILESLWHLTAREAPQGNIGKLTDEDIALAIDWDGATADLIDGLREAKWLDSSEEFRLLVHDWHEHADDGVKKKLQRANLPFLSVHVPTVSGHVAMPAEHIRLPEPEPEPLPVPVPRPEPTKILAPDAASSGQAELETSPEELIYLEYPRKVAHRAAIKAIELAVERVRKART